MKRILISTFLFSLFLMNPKIGNTFSNEINSEVKVIDGYCMKINKLVENNELPKQIFAAEMNTESWRLYKNQKQLDEYCMNRCYEYADVYYRGKNPIFISGMFTSPSGDWINYVFYYFHDNGSIKKIESDLRRFGAMEKGKEEEGNGFLVQVLRSKYFGPDGKLIKEGKPIFFNMNTKKDIKGEVDFMDGEWPIYTKVQQMPFYHLLKFSSAVFPKPCKGPRKLIYHLGFTDDDKKTSKKRMSNSINNIKTFAASNHIQLVEDSHDNYFAYTLVCDDETHPIRTIESDEDIKRECKDFFNLK